MPARGEKELQEWVDALQRGERVALFRAESALLFLALAPFLLTPLAMVATARHVDFLIGLFLGTWYLLLTPLLYGVVLVHQAEQHAAVQLGAGELIFWDCWGREQRISWSDLRRLEIRFLSWLLTYRAITIGFERDEEMHKALLPLHPSVRFQRDDVPDLPAAKALADLIAARAGLVVERYPWGEQRLVWVRPSATATPP